MLSRLTRVIPLVTALVAGVALLACSSGSQKVQISGVQARAVDAYRKLSSSAVTANGQVTQQGKTADIKLSYSAIRPERHRYESYSTFEGTEARTGLLTIGANAWELENGIWKPLAAGALPSASIFEAEHIWNLVPFEQAELQGTEPINGTPAEHYRVTRTVSLPVDGLVGSLLPSDEPALTGDLSRVEIDFWVDLQNGWPVRVSYRGTGDATFTLTATLEKANDDSIKIEPPP